MMKLSLAILLVALAGSVRLQTGDALCENEIELLETTPKPTRKPYVKKVMPPVNQELAADNLKATARFGLPSTDNLRVFNSFLLSYDRRLKGPVWVMEHLTGRNYEPKANRDLSSFKPDETLHKLFRARTADYLRPDKQQPGYDRGHMAPAGDFLFDQDSTDQSFMLSNVMPQTPQLNRGSWVRLEKYVSFLAQHVSTKNVYVVTGPLFLPEPIDGSADGELHVSYKVIGPDQLSVAPYFYKVFLRETQQGQLILDAFVMPNKHDDYLKNLKSIEEFRWPLDRLRVIEQATGLIFFDKLDRGQVSQPASGFELGYVDKKIIFRSGSKAE